MRRYRLHFDDGHVEHVDATTPSAAVMDREGGVWAKLPHTITDLTAMRHWLDKTESHPEGAS